jgi:hypothetical protein
MLRKMKIQVYFSLGGIWYLDKYGTNKKWKEDVL